jgi:hypothetical protein
MEPKPVSSTSRERTAEDQSATSRRPRAGLLPDDRARVPFAVLSVVLLVSSLAIVGHVNTREPAQTDTDPTLVMDRTDAAVQTALRDAVLHAAERAAERPLVEPSETGYGAVLDDDRPFRSYLKALVYLEARERLTDTGQQVGDARTDVSLPAITDSESFERALDRVTLSATGEDGLLTVAIEGIEITGRHDGSQFAAQTERVEVSVSNPVLQLHGRTERFQERLDANVVRPGFAQRFNARIYALGWARGYAQYLGQPVTDVISTRHIRPSANSALYRTQKSVFGAADPQLQDAVRRGWLCMAAKDAQGLYNSYTGRQRTVAGDVCKASEWVLGDDDTGALPEAPETQELLGDAPGTDASHSIGVNETAYGPLSDIVISDAGLSSLDDIIERVFAVETDIETDISAADAEFDHDKPRDVAFVAGTERTNQGVTVSARDASIERLPGAEYYAFEQFNVSITVEETQRWRWPEGDGEWGSTKTTATGTIEADVTVRLGEETIAPESNIQRLNDVGIDHRYERGPVDPEDSRTVPAPAGGFRNFAGEQRNITRSVIGGINGSAFGDWLSSQWSGVTSADALALPDTKTVTVSYDPAFGGTLEETIITDLAALQREMANVTHTVERRRLISQGETGPFDELLSVVNGRRAAMIDRDRAFENIGQLAVYEARYEYFSQLAEDLRAVANAHTEAMGQLDEQLQSVDSSLDEALTFLQQGMSAEEPNPIPLDSPDLTPNVTYEVSGSPTYLNTKTVTDDDVPAVDPETTFAPLATKNDNHLKMPYNSIVSGLLNKALELLGRGDSDAELTFRAAGEALRAGKLAADAAREDTYADTQNLTDLTSSLETSVQDAVRGFTRVLAREVVDGLYPGDESHENTKGAISDAAWAALSEYGSTAETAIALGGGNATGPIAEEVATALLADTHRPSYAANMTDESWAAVVKSTARPAVVTATGKKNVTVDNTNNIKALDTQTRQALEQVSRNLVRDRLRRYAERNVNISTYDDWVGGVDSPVRVPAGLPLLPVPGYWFATVNTWKVVAKGEYARFEVTATVGTPGQTSATTYVREDEDVVLDIAGSKRLLGEVEPIEFDEHSLLVVVVPPGGIGVGDRDDEDPECSTTYPVAGNLDRDDIECTPGI